jgi:enamine deaminase RidA (YjgF/YER057c/UK114 family)
MMKRTAINPVSWGASFAMNQAEITEDATRVLRCAGQTALVEDADAPHGLRVEGVGDIRRQMEVSLAAVDAILHEAHMERSNIVFIRFYTTDTGGFMTNYAVYADWIEPAHISPPQTVLGVAALASPELMVEIEVTAAT